MTVSKTDSKAGGQLYLLQDGTHADASDVSPDKGGVLRHKNGLAVALYADGTPQTLSEDAVRNKNVEAAKAGEEAAAKSVSAGLASPSTGPKAGESKPATAGKSKAK